jgi:hypothetical protein
MRSGAVLGIAASSMAMTGCALIFDSRPQNGGTDDPTDAGTGLPCALTAMPSVESIEVPDLYGDLIGRAPALPTFYDGVGADFSRGTPVLLRGGGFAAEVSVSATFQSGPAITIGHTAVASDGSMMAFVIHVPVLDTLDAGAVLTATELVLTQCGEALKIEDWAHVVGLNELAPTAAQLDVANLDPLYSSIVLGDHLLTDSSRSPDGARGMAFRLRATESIVLSGALSADGANDGTPGPGGCLGGGGSSGLDGACAGGGMGAVGGGGGAGHANAGEAAPSGGAGGSIAGDAYLTISDERGGSGGGGADGDTCPDARGGGGGGFVEIQSGGRLSLLDASSVSASGGSGADGSSDTCRPDGAGGGAGGTIWLRAGESLTGLQENKVSVAGGARGLEGCGEEAVCMVGGQGSPGRVRVEAADLASNAAGSFALGPSWAPDTPLVHVGVSSLELALARPAPSQGDFSFYLSHYRSTGSGFPAEPSSTVQPGVGPIVLSLDPGLHRYCLFPASRGQQLSQLPPLIEQDCIVLAALP